MALRFVGLVTTYVAIVNASSHMPARIAMCVLDRANTVVMPKEMMMAVTAIAFARTVNPSPALHPRTIPPKKRLLMSQVSKRSEDFENRNAARMMGPVVGMIGAMIPMKAMPTQIHPRTRRTVLSARLCTTAIGRHHT